MASGEPTLGSMNYGCASAATSGDTLICSKLAETHNCWERLTPFAGVASRMPVAWSAEPIWRIEPNNNDVSQLSTSDDL